jgi:hypothetical protein
VDNPEAATVAEAAVDRLRAVRYDDLVARLLDQVETDEVVGESGALYQVEMQALWDSGKPGDLRVMVAVDDGRWSAFRPVSRDFIVASDGSFVGE